MSPVLNGSSALQWFECSNAIEIHNRIMFDFYPGLPHIVSVEKHKIMKLMQVSLQTYIRILTIGLQLIDQHINYAQTLL